MVWMGQDAPAGQSAAGAAGGPISPTPIPTRPREHNPDAAIPGAAGWNPADVGGKCAKEGGAWI
jgi:hypothetical protein